MNANTIGFLIAITLYFMWGNFLYTVGALVCLGVGALYWYQGRLLYFPQVPEGARVLVPRPPPGTAFEELFLPTRDGSKATIHAYMLYTAAKSPAAAVTLLYFHGNAGNIGHRLPNALALVDLGFNVMLCEFRGYGRSTGEPTEAGLIEDGHTAYEHLARGMDGKIDPSRIVILGRSLGGAVAIALAANLCKALGDSNDGAAGGKLPRPLGLIMENTFTSVLDMIDVVMPAFRRVKFLCNNKWLSEERLAHVTLPILFLSGASDELIPPAQMQRNYEAARGVAASRRIVVFPGGKHNDTWLEPNYYESITGWVAGL